jgi:hypothetical protein
MLASAYALGLIGPGLRAATLQQPLGHDPATVPKSRYTFGQRSRFLNGTMLMDNFSGNVGDNTGIEYTVQVYLDGDLVCEELLDPINLSVNPETNFFSSSSYLVDRGSITDNTYSPSNPFYFALWSAGTVNVNMEGYGCKQWTPDIWVSDDTVTISQATVTLASASCPL